MDFSHPILFVATVKPDLARTFYADRLGLPLLEDTPFALVFQAGEHTLRVQKAHEPFTPLPFTMVGWQVPDIRQAARELIDRGVELCRYPHLEQDELGVWQVPGAKVCWFQDPDGNTLSLTEHG